MDKKLKIISLIINKNKTQIMKKIILLVILGILVTSCSTLTSSIKNPSNYIEFTKNDFEYTKQVSSSSSVDFLFGFSLTNTRKKGKFSRGTTAIVGFSLSKLSKAENMAIYDLLKANPGYDVVLYPKFDTKMSGFILTKAEVKVTARLAKLKN